MSPRRGRRTQNFRVARPQQGFPKGIECLQTPLREHTRCTPEPSKEVEQRSPLALARQRASAWRGRQSSKQLDNCTQHRHPALNRETANPCGAHRRGLRPRPVLAHQCASTQTALAPGGSSRVASLGNLTSPRDPLLCQRVALSGHLKKM